MYRETNNYKGFVEVREIRPGGTYRSQAWHFTSFANPLVLFAVGSFNREAREEFAKGAKRVTATHSFRHSAKVKILARMQE